MKSIPTLHMWHDYVCPFCNVEATRIQRIKNADHLHLDVSFHPWPLAVANGAQPTAGEEDRWVRLLRPLEPGAFADWNPSSGCWPASSRLLFAAYEAARTQDISLAERFDLLVRQSIFQHPLPIDSIAALCELAGAVGLDVAAFKAMLEDGSAARRAESAGDGAQELEIRGVPTLVLPDGSQVISPGLKIHRTEQAPSIRDDIEVLRGLLRRAAEGVPAGMGRD